MNQYVAVWAQEGYADARAWGVDGASLDERAAALNAYALHAQKLAANYPVVRDFFARAYTPFGNASYRYPIPAVGPFPGYTDIGYPSLFDNFVSAQVYARRSSTPNRFGFDVAPINTGGQSVRQGIEAHLGAAIRDSQDDPLGACTAVGESCDGAVPGAFFPATWPNFATPPAVTSHVAGPQADDGWYTGDVSVSWDVSDAQTGVDTAAGCDSETVTQDTAGMTFTCTATSPGGSTTRSVTIRRDTTPPVVVPRISGAIGTSGWYVGDVTVSWDVTESLSPVQTMAGCETTAVVQDTSGALVTCAATSDGGTSSKSVLIRRDATAPGVTCSATPAALWPPNGKLVPVQVDVEVADATPGAAGYVLSAAPEGWNIGSPDVAGFLRATKDSTYTLTYTARDAAGNTATCNARVTVPHDQGQSAGTP
jgi:hypothetical protein